MTLGRNMNIRLSPLAPVLLIRTFLRKAVNVTGYECRMSRFATKYRMRSEVLEKSEVLITMVNNAVPVHYLSGTVWGSSRTAQALAFGLNDNYAYRTM